MSVEYAEGRWTGRAAPRWGVSSEVSVLTDVMLCGPSYLAPVPCCSVTRESLREGFEVSRTLALAQHRQLRRRLEAHGVTCHVVPPHHEMADLCFARDAAVMTPWGLLGLRPAAPHRAQEAAHVMASARRWNAPILGQVEAGTAEGGDICIVRPGLVIIGCSGDRTDERGAEEVAGHFRARGWQALIHRFDPHFLHLDTQFCMAGADLALACLEVLDDRFITELRSLGIALAPVTYKEARKLGCNVLALGDRRVMSTSDSPRVNAMLGDMGLDVDVVDLSQFSRCGGGVHCLTAPLARMTPH
jgi:N-dimethylarginine dimethylaminohydrolase